MHQLMPTCMKTFLHQRQPDALMHIIQEATTQGICGKHCLDYNMLWRELFHELLSQPLRATCASVSLDGFTRCLTSSGQANTDNKAVFTLMPPAYTHRISVSLSTSKWLYHHWKLRQQKLDRRRVSVVIITCRVT